MKISVLALLLVVTLAAAPAQAQVPGGEFGGLDALLGFLRQLEQQVEQIIAWMWEVVDYTDAARESLAPILDRVHSAQVIARRIDALAMSLPNRVQSSLNSLAARLRSVPAPRSGTPRWVVEQVIRSNPNGDTAHQARTLDQVTEQNATALATARSAAETARSTGQQVAQDLGPQADAQAAIAAARELALRAQNTPSTRAAMQLLVEALAAQMDQESRMAVHMIGRETAVIQQQTLLSQQLAAVVDRLAAVTEQQNAQQKELLARRTAAAASVVESQRQTYSEIAQGLLTLNSGQRQQAMERFFTALTGRP